MRSLNTAIDPKMLAPATNQTIPLYKRMYIQVIVGMLAGTLLGLADPHIGAQLQPLGFIFIKAIRMIIAPVIFLTIVAGIGKMGDIRQVANVGVKALIYFELSSTLALIIGMLVINVWPIGTGIHADPAHLDAASIQGYVQSSQNMPLVNFLMNIIPQAFLEPFVTGNMLQVVAVATLFGFALIMTGEKGRPIVDLLDRTTYTFFAIVRIIMYIAPLAAFGGMAYTVSKFGAGTLIDIGQLILGVYLVNIFFVVVVLGATLKVAGFNIWQVLSYFKDEWLFCLAATAAEAMMPHSMEKLERLGVSREVVGLVMPSGFSFNTAGGAIYMTMAIMFMAHALDIPMSIGQQLVVLFVMLFTSKGAAGITGAGFVALAATLPTVSAIPIGALALLIGADSFMAQIRAATNLMCNVIAVFVVGRWVGAIDYERATRMLATNEAEYD
jgi:aerobic C4-dicarboxylate transport protein